MVHKPANLLCCISFLDGQGYGNEREEQSLDSDSNTKNDNIDLELLPMGSNESESSLSGMVKKEGVGKVNEENAEENDDEEMDNEDADATFIPDHEDEGTFLLHVDVFLTDISFMQNCHCGVVFSKHKPLCFHIVILFTLRVHKNHNYFKCVSVSITCLICSTIDLLPLYFV